MAPTPALSGMLSPLPNLGATITWTTRCCGQDRRNEASRHAAEESGSGLAAPCSRCLLLGPCISFALATARFYIAAPFSAMPALTSTVHSPGRGLTKPPCFLRGLNAAIINSLGATKLRLVAPSALVLSLLPAGRGFLPCLPAYCPA
jgi:hypothetical protein